VIEAIIVTALVVAQLAIHTDPTWQIDLADVFILVGLGLVAGVICGALITDTMRQKYRNR